MTRSLLLALLALVSCFALPCAAQAAAASTSADLAQEAERAYREGDYARAQKNWRALLEQRGSDGRLEYDLGNCAYRLGEPARAVWRFERAQRALGADERVRFNLALAERALGLEGAESTSFFEDARARITRLDAAAWFRYGLGLELLGLVLLALAIRMRARGLGAFALLLVLLGALSLARCATLDDERVLGAVVLQEGTKVRAEPREALAPTMRLGAGVRVEHLASSPQWVRIRYQGREGWVQRGRVGLY